MLECLGILEKHGETFSHTFAPEGDVDGHLCIIIVSSVYMAIQIESYPQLFIHRRCDATEYLTEIIQLKHLIIFYNVEKVPTVFLVGFLRTC